MRHFSAQILAKAKPHVIADVLHKLKGIVKADENQDQSTDIADDVDLTVLSAFAGPQALDLISQAAGDSGTQFLIEIGVAQSSDLFMQVNTRALAYAKANAAELVTQIDDTTRDEIREIIASSISEGLTYKQVSDKLQDMYAFSDVRSDMIARTEIADANNSGVIEGMRDLKRQGAKIKKAWNPDAGACPICVENGDAGFIDLEDDFPSGDPEPTAHPNCECNLISEIQDEDDEEDS